MRTGLVAILFLPAVALAQSGGGYDLSHNAIAGGGATFSSGGNYQLGGTIGQAAAGTLTGGAFAVHAGFWSAPLSVPPPTATRTAAVNTPTATPPPSVTTTRSPPPTPTASMPLATSSPTRSSTVTATTSTPTHGPTTPASPSSAPTASPTPTPPPETCSGDCNGDGTVTVDELIRGVNVALGTAAVDTCAAMDGNADGTVVVNELIAAVNRALSGCPTAADDSSSRYARDW